MDIGKRPSRLRRHLPLAMPNLDVSSSHPSGDTDGEDSTAEEDKYSMVSRSSYWEYQSGETPSLRRRRRRRRPTEDVRTPDARQLLSKSIIRDNQERRSTVFRWLFWIGCGGWAVFLLFRVIATLWQGSYEQLSLIHFITRSWNP
ncbi:hypothetical protein BX666DRAFT_2029796 [Dichotomocladium elegans]|nr:hypothetical protein BX666DRAFT_2029796 [Dichotomocladium elegans]